MIGFFAFLFCFLYNLKDCRLPHMHEFYSGNTTNADLVYEISSLFSPSLMRRLFKFCPLGSWSSNKSSKVNDKAFMNKTKEQL